MIFQEQGKEPSEMLLDFLLVVARATANISRENPADAPWNDQLAQVSEKARYLLEVIAKNLLSACEPYRLLWSTEDLVPLGSKSKLMAGQEDDGVNLSFQPYNYRRTDYLRLLLRFMAPISMHVASQVCHIITHGRDGCKASGLEAQSAFLLFSHWLPVAPHLTPMATDLFRSLEDPWKEPKLNNLYQTFLFVEASYNLCAFFGSRGQAETIKRIWDWTFLFGILEASDTEMDDSDGCNDLSKFIPEALHWYAARSLTALLDWKPQVAHSVLERLNIDNEQVPWQLHQWAIEDEEKEMQDASFRGLSTLWGSEEFPVPSADQIASLLPLSNYLAHVGNGIFFYKAGALTILASAEKKNSSNVCSKERSLIPTTTTCENLALLGAALCQDPHPPPIMLCGPQGSGKSSVLREMLRVCRPGDSLLEFHIDEETDSKTLIGSYSTTDVPGEFAWRPGALTHASREGRWVLFEDIDTVPVEIQANIIKLLEDRLLPLGNGKYEKIHPDFRMFATCTTKKSGNENKASQRFGARTGAGRRILSPSLWRKVHIEPLPFAELKEVAVALYPHIPLSIIEVALAMMKTLDRSGRTAIDDEADESTARREIGPVIDSRSLSLYTGGRCPSVRDFFKLLSRISNGICFERNATYATEAQRMICLTECVEILVGSCADVVTRHDFVTRIAAPAWGISGQLAMAYIDSRCPTTQMTQDYVEIGRVQINLGRHSELVRRQSGVFAQTNYALRLMESIGVCIRQNEPVLLVGETGCGKTTMVQQLASLCDRELIVQNLSLQTDSTDLLGGFKPLELKNVARKVYLDFVDLFCSSFSRKQNATFLEFAASSLEKESWKKLSQCFQKASKLGMSKMKERMQTEEGNTSRKNRDLSAGWKRFKDSSAKFERQIISCDAGLAFVFAEGALVEAIKQGKW
jgi:MoxR-like ATPase